MGFLTCLSVCIAHTIIFETITNSYTILVDEVIKLSVIGLLYVDFDFHMVVLVFLHFL
jgi:hypothetical protein